MKKFLLLVLACSCCIAQAAGPSRATFIFGRSERPISTPVYEQMADPDVHDITLQNGRFNFGNGDIVITRSDLTIHGNHSTFVDRPGDYAGLVHNPITVAGQIINAGYRVSRFEQTRVDGPITPSTTSLTMDREYVDLSPGDEVMIFGGVNFRTDAAEAERLIYATVDTVTLTGAGMGPAYGDGHDGTNSGGSFSGGTWNGNGTTSRINVGENLDVQTANSALTISAWVQTTATTTQTIVCDSFYGGAAGSWAAQINGSGNPVFYALPPSFGDGTMTVDTATVNDGNPHHIVFVYDDQSPPGTKRVRCYVDNTLKKTVSFLGMGDGTLSRSTFGTLIGASFNSSNSTYTQNFNGKIWSLGISLRDLSDKVGDLYHSGTALTWANLGGMKSLFHNYWNLVTNADDGVGLPSDVYTITFTAPLGQNVDVFTDVDDLKSQVVEWQWYKIDDSGEWGVDLGGAINRGLGLSHGMTRFVGGTITKNVAFRDLNFESIMPAVISGDTLPRSHWFLYAYNSIGVSCTNMAIKNVSGSEFFANGSFNFTVDKCYVTGVGAAVQGDNSLITGQLIGTWGAGDELYRDIYMDHCLNVVFLSSEVACDSMTIVRPTFDNCDWDTRNNANDQGLYFGSFGMLQTPMVMDSPSWLGVPSIQMRGSYPELQLSYDGFPSFTGVFTTEDSKLPFALEFNEANFDTFSINGNSYGTLVSSGTITRTIGTSLSPGGLCWVEMPRGLYKSMRIKLTTVGDCDQVFDLFDDQFTGVLAGGVWVNGVSKWIGIAPGTGGSNTLDNYFRGTRTVAFHFNGGGTPGQVQIECEYWPETGADQTFPVRDTWPP